MVIFSSMIKTWVVILLSFLGGWILMFLHYPAWFDWLSPPWIVLLLLYWALMLPRYVNVGFAWLSGCFLDLGSNTILGEHALALVIVTYVIVKFRQKIIPLDLGKMLIVIFSLVMLYRLLQGLVQLYSGSYFNGWSILGSAFVSALIWPFLNRVFNAKLKPYI